MDVRRVVIVGSGPAGYTAAIYAARADLKPLVFAGEIYGGQLMNTTVVENWPGREQGVMGPELMAEMRAQAIRFGAEMIDTRVVGLETSARPFRVRVEGGEHLAEAVILATGAESIMLGVEGEQRLLGRGVATCAVCDAAFYRDKQTFVVGGGDAAAEDVLALTKFATQVTLLVRGDVLKASKIMARRVLEHDKVRVMWQTELKAVLGAQKVEGLRVVNNQTGEEQELPADGVFLAIGHKPATDFLRESGVTLDEKGYVVTRLGLHRMSVELAAGHIGEQGLLAFPTMTSVEGVFAAGDNVDFRYRQAITAAAYGSMAALDAERWLEGR